MVRSSIVFVACALLLAACDRAPNAPRELQADVVSPENLAIPSPAISVSPTPQAAQQFSYTHGWSVIMARETVTPRFTRARDLCLHERTLNCKLVSANITSGSGELASVSATLEVQLPHARLDMFERALLAPVKGEGAGDAVMQSRSTQAQSVETAAGDTARKVAQLSTYRDRLADIAKRPNLNVDDMIKLEAEGARVQTDLDEATGQQRTLTDGIAREDVSITLTERVDQVHAGAFTQFARDAADRLGENTAAALLFAIGALPWLPIIAIVIWLVSRLWRWLLQRRTLRVAIRREAATEPTPSG